MAQAWQAFPSGVASNGVNAVDRTWVDPPESIGQPIDSPATSVSAENSAFALLKGIASELGVPAGTGAGDINNNSKVYGDPLETLGEMSDPPATGTGRNSAISLMKGILTNAGLS